MPIERPWPAGGVPARARGRGRAPEATSPRESYFFGKTPV